MRLKKDPLRWSYLAFILWLAGCASIDFAPAPRFRPTQPGEPVPMIGGNVPAPGTPWFIENRPDRIRKDLGVLTVLTTGSFESLEGILRRAFTVNIGPLGADPKLPGNELISVLSLFYFRQVIFTKPDIEFAKEDIVSLYQKKGVPVTDIKDISGEYEEKLKFWNGYMFALAYKAGGEDYRVVHAFTVVPGPKPDSNVLNDFSYIRMEKPGTKDHFDDFVAMLKSLRPK